MKKPTFLWIAAVLMSGIFIMPKTAFSDDRHDDRNYDYRDNRNYDHRLEGRWYFNGDPSQPAEIHSDRRGLEARNEKGDTSRLDVDRNGDIRAIDWNGIRGRVRGGQIDWSNGTRWVRRPSEHAGRR
jgi:hypothetical protein